MVLGSPAKRVDPFAYRTITFYGYSFQSIRLKSTFVTLRPHRAEATLSPTTPHTQRARAYMYAVWADPRSLAATKGIAVAFFSSGY